MIYNGRAFVLRPFVLEIKYKLGEKLQVWISLMELKMI